MQTAVMFSEAKPKTEILQSKIKGVEKATIKENYLNISRLT